MGAKKEDLELAQLIIEVENDLTSSKKFFTDAIKSLNITEEQWPSFYKKNALKYHPDKIPEDVSQAERETLERAMKALGQINKKFNDRKHQKEQENKIQNLSGAAKEAYQALDSTIKELRQVSKDLNASKSDKNHRIVPMVNVYIKTL
ncbi:MAG TPA: hypothetical protein PLD88_12500, partial [Candidatus Berkiella sp.]|nr:hypothetical protein [Candidatus Berkiella sp.]